MLASGNSYSNTTTVKLPEEISGEYYIFATSDSGGRVFEFLSEDNNTARSVNPIAINLKPVPDLQVSSINNDLSGQPGTKINVDWTISNQGTAAALGNRVDRVYLSSDGTLDNAIQIQEIVRPQELAVGSEQEVSAEIVLPNNIADGDYQLIVVTDATEQIFERGEENNNQLIAEETIQIRHADITSSLNIPTSITSGTSLPLNWMVENKGTGKTLTSWTDKVYLSEDETFNPSQDELIGEYRHNESIASGETKQVEVASYQIPVGSSGNKYIFVVNDANKEIQELEGENNNVVANPIEIELAPYADLAVSNVTAPNLTIDDPAKVKVSWTVTNQGTGTGYSDTWVDRVIVSKDETVGNGDDLVIGEYTHTGFLAESESYNRSENILLPPAFTGRYNLFVKTDAKTRVFENSLEENNVGRQNGFFDVMTIPYADLQITEVETLGTANSGQPITVNWSVTNSGIGLTNISEWSDRLYLALDPQGKNIVADLGTFDRAGALAVGKNYNRSVQVTLPEGISGEHYIVAKTGGPFEFIYNDNNSLVSNPFNVTFTAPPDLAVTNIVAPEAITSGQKIDLTWTVANQGTGNAAGNWRDNIYLQEVGNPNAGLISLAGYSYEGELNPGKSYTRQEKISIPGELQGLYQVVVRTNTASNSDLFEPNKDNNQTVDDGTLQITLPPRPDLQVQSIVAPNKVSAAG